MITRPTNDKRSTLSQLANFSVYKNFPAFVFKNQKIQQLILMLDVDRFTIHCLAEDAGVDLMEQVCNAAKHKAQIFRLTSEEEGKIFFALKWYAEDIKQTRKLIQEIGIEQYMEDCAKEDYEKFRHKRTSEGFPDPSTESIFVKMQRIAANKNV